MDKSAEIRPEAGSRALLTLIVVSLIAASVGLGVAMQILAQAVFIGPARLPPEPAKVEAAAPLTLPAAPFVLPAESPVQRAHAINCMTEAVYYEAGFEPLPGQRAVAQVILNRLRDRNFPASVCGVVYQGAKRRTGCQFSFVCDGSRRRRPPGLHEWNRARVVAVQALGGYVMAAVGTATHYHTHAVDPWWRSTVVQVAQIGAHVFYRWPGKAGLPSALKDRYDGREPAFAKPPRT